MAEPVVIGASPEKKSLQLSAAHGGRPRLLLAEDCDPVRIVTAAMLKGMGCDVEAVIHGEDAVKSASENEFDVIVLDIEMPIMDGIEATGQIRKIRGKENLPILAMTANAFSKDKETCTDAGMNDHIAKPVKPDQLYALLLRWLPRVRSPDEPSKATPVQSNWVSG